MGDNKVDFNRIVIFTDAWEPQVNGVVTTLKKMVEYAERDNYLVDVISPELFKLKIKLKMYPEVPLTIPFGISKLINWDKQTVYHIATEGPIGLIASILLKSKGKKYTTSYHTDWPKFLKQLIGLPTCVTTKYLRWFYKNLTIYCPTLSVVNFLNSNSIGNHKILWSRGVDYNIFMQKKRAKKNKHKPILLSVGRISKEKNLEVFCELSNDYTKIIVGDGPYRVELEKKYPNVIFVGYKFGKELANYYQNADCFVFTSKSDTFGVVMIESMFCGTPVAAYPVQGPQDVLDNKYLGFTDTNIENAIKKCLSLSRSKCAKIARKTWTWEQSYKIFVNNLIIG